MTPLLLFIALIGQSVDDYPVLADLPTCSFEQSVDRASWKTVSHEGVELQVPAEYERVENAFFVHGGDAWRDGDSAASLSWGHFGFASFYQEDGTFGEGLSFCRQTCGSEGRIIAEREEDTRVRYMLFAEPAEVSKHQPMVSASGPVDNRSVALAIVLSACEATPGL